MSLIVLTCEDDLHTDAVIKRLSERRPSFEVIRVNTEQLSKNIDYSFHWSQSAKIEGQVFYLRDSRLKADSPSVIWYRKPDQPLPHSALKDQAAMQCSSQEYKEFLRSIEGFFPKAAWVNDFWQMQRYSIKANQMALARAVGLSVPETLITSSLDAVKKLASRHSQTIVKPLAFNGFADGHHQYGCFTHVLTNDEIRDLDPQVLEYAPAIYQQRIPKVQELRITVVGDEVFACEIRTAPGTESNVDWRIQDVEELPHRIVELPREFTGRLKQMLNLMGLNFGAFDVIKDETETYYFIEVNPNGQYLWIELLTEAPITEAMVSLILRLSGD